MNASAAARPIEKHIVLVGAGNAHLQFVKRWSMRPAPSIAVTLVSEFAQAPYSAMVPAHIAGDYGWDEITIDLVRLCAVAKVRLVAARVTALDPPMRRVLFDDRPPLTYDVLALGLGSMPACPEQMLADDRSLVMRPLGTMVRKLTGLENALKHSPRPFHLVVVGGGASGCELALAIRKRFASHSGFRLTLLQANAQLLPQYPAGVSARFRELFAHHGVTVQVNARVTDCSDGALMLENGERIVCDSVLWATNASPPKLLLAAGLSLDSGGFLRVTDALQSVGEPTIFGSGDCVSFVSRPDLPKNGVHAVRQGGVLFDNLLAFLHEKPLRQFRPQRYCLSLLNTADGEAIFNYGPLSGKGRWLRRLKDRIDRAWIEKFTPAMPTTTADPEAPLMRCGGCGSKISSDVLSAVLKRLDIPDDPRILMGCRTGEDAAVHRVQPELYGEQPGKLVEVQTVDYFRAFIDDPFLFGRIAALHSVSDLYAMNARPFSALAIATLPYARGPIQEAQLYELLSGAVHTFRQLGVILTGGHTTEGTELALGFAVTGHGEEDRLFHKSQLQPGDKLVLTKPLGSGALLAAWMRGACKARWLENMLESLLVANAAAAGIFSRAGVHACTDITGFGLAGHLFEMLDASRVSALLSLERVPLYDGFAEVTGQGIVSSLHADNAKLACRIEGATALPAWLFDPQTSGGLLAAVRPDAVNDVVEELRRSQYAKAAVIGEVQPATEGTSLRAQ